MDSDSLRNKSIGIVGFGQEGQAIARYLHQLQIPFAIFDNAEKDEQWTTEARGLLKQLNTDIHPFEDSSANLLNSFDVIFKSPGIPRSHTLIRGAEGCGVVITSQTEFFFENFKGQIIAVTGTKGKGTTSSLINNILRRGFEGDAKRQIYLTGNIGKIQPLEFLKEATSEDIAVYELSSFQLQGLSFSPHTAVVLMITEDHLDHHKDLAEYHEAKSSITKSQTVRDLAIYNIDYPASKIIGELSKGKKLSVTSGDKEIVDGARIHGNVVEIFEDKACKKTYDFSQRLLKGQHNMENIAAAVMAVQEFGLDDNLIQDTVNQFRGLEHRLEFVKEINDVKFINDSIATITAPTIAAIRSFDEPIILILGGSEKGLNYVDLVVFLKQTDQIKGILFVGKTGKTLYGQLQDSDNFINLGHTNSLADGMKQIKTLAKAGDVVLLSPAAASFDMFKSYKHRGDEFKSLVNDWENL